MTDAISVVVEGDPKGQPRAKAFASNGHARVYDPGTAEGWKAQVALALRPWKGQARGGPVTVSIGFRFRRPKSHYTAKGALTKSAPRRHLAKPDVDNCVKAVLDACTHLRVWQDDTQVVEQHATKRYAERGEMPGATLTIQWLEGVAAVDPPPEEDAPAANAATLW